MPHRLLTVQADTEPARMLCLSVSQLIRRGQTWYLLATLALLMGQLAKAQLEADYEFQIFEELPPGHTVGNLIEAMYAPLAHSPGQQRQGSMPHEGSGVSGIENDGNSGLRFQILNAAEQGASLFTIQPNGNIVVAKRVDRDQLCPTFAASDPSNEAAITSSRQQRDFQHGRLDWPWALQSARGWKRRLRRSVVGSEFTHDAVSMPSSLPTSSAALLASLPASYSGKALAAAAVNAQQLLVQALQQRFPPHPQTRGLEATVGQGVGNPGAQFGDYFLGNWSPWGTSACLIRLQVAVFRRRDETALFGASPSSTAGANVIVDSSRGNGNTISADSGEGTGGRRSEAIQPAGGTSRLTGDMLGKEESGGYEIVAVRILVHDLNDNPPAWPGHGLRYQIRFRDGDKAGESRPLPTALDIDDGLNSRVSYRLEVPTPHVGAFASPSSHALSSGFSNSASASLELGSLPFRLTHQPGGADGLLLLQAMQTVDREEAAAYHFLLIAEDRAIHAEDSDPIATATRAQAAMPSEGSLASGSGSSSSDDLGAMAAMNLFDREPGFRPLRAVLPVSVIVEDVNDNPPLFEQAKFETSTPIPEVTPVGRTVLRLKASDRDAGQNGAFHFAFSRDHSWRREELADRQFFEVKTNGDIVIKKPLNVDKRRDTRLVNTLSNPEAASRLHNNQREPVHEFKFHVMVEDEAIGPYALSSQALVVIKVVDENDEVPQIIASFIRPGAGEGDAEAGVKRLKYLSRYTEQPSVLENQPVNTLIASIQVFDPDFGGTDRVDCHLTNPNFTLVRRTGQPPAQVAAYGDLATFQRTDLFSSSGLTGEYGLGPPGNLISGGEITGGGRASDGTIAISPGGAAGHVSSGVGSFSGALGVIEYSLVTAIPLDREETQVQQVRIICTDQAGHRTYKNISLRIADTNDHAPVFTRSVFHLQVAENSPPGTPLQPVSGFGPLVQAAGWHLLATDHDVGANARIEYRLAGVPTEDGAEVTGVTNFSIDAASGVISTRVVFDREEAETYQIQVFAVDHGSPRLTGTGTVQLTITDVNDNPPQFLSDSYLFHVSENEPRNTRFGEVTARDADSPLLANGRLSYALIGPPDDQSTDLAVASSSAGVTPGPSVTASLPFKIDQNSGVLMTRRPLDREIRSHYIFRVLARDLSEYGPGGSVPVGGKIGSATVQHTSTTTVTVIVDDVNDNAPVFVSPNAKENMLAVAASETIGHKLAYIRAVDPDADDNGLVTYAIRAGNENGYFSLDAKTGLLFLADSLRRPARLVESSSSGRQTSNKGHGTGVPQEPGSSGSSSPTGPGRASNSSPAGYPLVHLLNLEACDQGREPRPKCTVFKNLRILISDDSPSLLLKSLAADLVSGRSPVGASAGGASYGDGYPRGHESVDVDARSGNGGLNSIRFGTEDARDDGFLGSDGVASSLRSSPSRSVHSLNGMTRAEVSALSVELGSHGQAGGLMLTSGELNVVGGLKDNEVVIVCMAIIFVILLIATATLVFLIRRRSFWTRRGTPPKRSGANINSLGSLNVPLKVSPEMGIGREPTSKPGQQLRHPTGFLNAFQQVPSGILSWPGLLGSGRKATCRQASRLCPTAVASNATSAIRTADASLAGWPQEATTAALRVNRLGQTPVSMANMADGNQEDGMGGWAGQASVEYLTGVGRHARHVYPILQKDLTEAETGNWGAAFTPVPKYIEHKQSNWMLNPDEERRDYQTLQMSGEMASPPGYSLVSAAPFSAHSLLTTNPSSIVPTNSMVGSAEAVLGLPNSSMYYAVGLSVGGGITPDAGLVTLASGRWEDGAAGVGPEKYRPVMACTGLHDQTDAEPTRRMGCMLREEGMGSGCRDPNEWTVRDTVEDGQQADKSLLPTSTQARRCHLYYDVRNATASEVSVDQMLPYASSPRWRPRSPDLTTAPASLMMLPRSKSQLIATSSRPTFNVEIFPRDANLQLSQQEPHIKEDSSFGLLQTKVLGRPGIVAFRPIDLEIGSEGNDLELDGEEDDNQVYDPANAGVAIDNTNKLDTNSRSLLLLTQLPGQTPLQSEVYRLPGEKPLITQKGFEFQTDDTTSSTNVTSSSIIRSGNPPEERHKPTKYVQAAYREASFV